MPFQIDDTIVDSHNAKQSWEEATHFDGKNNVSNATGSEWDHETLHLSAKGRYWIECHSQYQGSTPSAKWATNEAAYAWLRLNDHEVPAELTAATDCEE